MSAFYALLGRGERAEPGFTTDYATLIAAAGLPLCAIRSGARQPAASERHKGAIPAIVFESAGKPGVLEENRGLALPPRLLAALIL